MIVLEAGVYVSFMEDVVEMKIDSLRGENAEEFVNEVN